MKNLIYIGSNETYMWFKKETPQESANLRLLSAKNLTAQKIKNFIYDSEKLWAIIINIDEIPCAISNIESLVEELLSECENVKLCIMAAGYSLTNDTLQMLLELGVQYLMPYTNDKGNLNVYKQLLDANNHSNIEEVFLRGAKKSLPHKIEPTEEITDNNSEISNDEAIERPTIISIGSCISRMGATTLAMQILFSLCTDKKKVCYIDSTKNSEYMKAFLKAWDNKGIYDYDYNMFSLIGIDFYYDMNKNILRHIFTDCNYDYILYDYGCIYQDDKKIRFFLNSDIKLLVGGSKCNEYVRMMDMCEQFKDNDVKLLFNFVKSSKQKSISQFLDKYNYEYYFIPFILDEFDLQEKTYKILNKIFKFELYKEILNEIKNKKKG